MSDLLTERRVRECNSFVRLYFADRRKCGQVPLTDDQLRQINEITPQRDQAMTCRLDMDVDKLRDEAGEKGEELHHTINRRLVVLCRDLEHFISQKTDGGDRLLFTAPVQLYLARDAFKLQALLWMDYVEVRPQEKPSCPVPITPPTPSPA